MNDELCNRVIELYTSVDDELRPRTMETVANMTRLSRGQVDYILRKSGIPRRPKGNGVVSDAMKARIVSEYLTPFSDGTWKGAKLIADDLGISEAHVWNVLRSQGVEMRSIKEAHAHGKRCGPIKHTAQFDEPPLCDCGCGTPVRWVRSKYAWAKFAPGHYRKDAAYKDEAWLRREYVDNRRTLKSIATECGTITSNVAKFMKKFSIPRRHIRDALKGTQAGANNPAWRGGTTPERQRLYKAGGWREFSLSIYRRDNFTCRRCGSNVSSTSARGVAAHHVKSWAGHPELRFDPENIVTLCRACHLWVHSLANVDREFLA